MDGSVMGKRKLNDEEVNEENKNCEEGEKLKLDVLSHHKSRQTQWKSYVGILRAVNDLKEVVKTQIPKLFSYLEPSVMLKEWRL